MSSGDSSLSPPKLERCAALVFADAYITDFLKSGRDSSGSYDPYLLTMLLDDSRQIFFRCDNIRTVWMFLKEGLQAHLKIFITSRPNGDSSSSMMPFMHFAMDSLKNDYKMAVEKGFIQGVVYPTYRKKRIHSTRSKFSETYF